MNLHYPDTSLRDILRRVKTIAMVGASPDWVRPSHFAMKYLQRKGYRVIPVNPRAAGAEILGEEVYGALAVTDEAIEIASEKGIEVIWMQLGVVNREAAARAEAAGLSVVMDRCAKIEYGRLFGELGWSGVNSRIITAKRAPFGR